MVRSRPPQAQSQTPARRGPGAIFGLRLAVALGVSSGLAHQAHADLPGIRLGRRAVIHASLATELRYDSNMFFSNRRLGQGLPASAQNAAAVRIEN